MSEPSYYASDRTEMLPFLPPNMGKIVDIGCADGNFLKLVKRGQPNCLTYGVEIVDAAAEKAKMNVDVLVKDSVAELPNILSDQIGTFDAVVMNDVLEHIESSEDTLSICRRLLKPTGRLILSLPNIRFYLTMRDLILKGRWDYQDFGILDRTHLRFFTQKSACDLLRRCGFDVNLCEGINRGHLRRHYALLFKMLPKRFSDMTYPQFAIVATPAGEQESAARARVFGSARHRTEREVDVSSHAAIRCAAYPKLPPHACLPGQANCLLGGEYPRWRGLQTVGDWSADASK